MYDTNVACGELWLHSGYALADPNKPQLERALSTFDVPQMLKFSYSYDLPIGAARRSRQHAARVGCDDRRLEDQRHLGAPLGPPVELLYFEWRHSLPTYGRRRPNWWVSRAQPRERQLLGE